MSGFKRVNAIYKINKGYWDRLEVYFSLPWYKRLFKRIPKS